MDYDDCISNVSSRKYYLILGVRFAVMFEQVLIKLTAFFGVVAVHGMCS